MLQFTYPGVYTQELPSGVKTISGASTSIALFIGPTMTGIDNRATRLMNFGDYQRSFGDLSAKSNLSYSVLHFFANGGGEAFVIRVPVDGAVSASMRIAQDGAATEAVLLKALSSGSGGNEIYVEIDPFGLGAKPYETGHNKKIYNLTISDRLTGQTERFGALETTSGANRFAPTVVNDAATGSKLISLTMPASTTLPDGAQPTGSIYAIGALPSGTFAANPVMLEVTVEIPDAAGALPAAPNVVVPVTIQAASAAKIQSPLELVTVMGAAINAAIRGDATAAPLMEGVGIDVEMFEGGKLFRLRTSAPGPATLTKRLSEAVVKVRDPTASTSPSPIPFFTAYAVTEKAVNASRFRIGFPHTYAGNQVIGTPAAMAPVAGTDGDVSGQPKTDDLKAAVLALETPDPFFNILCLPDLVRPSTNDPNALQHASAMSIYSEAARICKEKFAFLLIDPFPNVVDVISAEAWKSGTFTFQTSHAAAYFPNIRVDDPLVPGAIRSHPPSGAIAGLYARTDSNVGVWQAPAGVEAVLNGVYGPSVVLSDDQHGILNPIGLNVIRQFRNYGTVSFGSRTVDGSNALASEWKYIPVRRTALYLLRSISEGTRWAVHKPNGEQLWADIRMNVKSFMQGMFRLGAFKGSSPSDAYFVLCDSSTTIPADIEIGIVNIVVGFAPLKPAEFVVISLKQMTAKAA